MRKQIIDAGILTDLLSDEVKLYMRPELPTVRYEKSGVHYEITSMDLLRQDAVEIFYDLVNAVAGDSDLTEYTVSVGPDIPEKDLESIIDIVSGFTYKASRRGKNGWKIDGVFLICGCRIARTPEETILSFMISDDHARVLHNIPKPCSITAVIETCVMESLRGFRDMIVGGGN
ncbi:MAG: hypothetical protein IKF70_03185 [Firmicutes bacterium]|nr:hypothetical protein [Bacillota bacterium]